MYELLTVGRCNAVQPSSSRDMKEGHDAPAFGSCSNSLQREHPSAKGLAQENIEPIQRVRLPFRAPRVDVIETSLARIAVDCPLLNN